MSKRILKIESKSIEKSTKKIDKRSMYSLDKFKPKLIKIEDKPNTDNKEGEAKKTNKVENTTFAPNKEIKSEVKKEPTRSNFVKEQKKDISEERQKRIKEIKEANSKKQLSKNNVNKDLTKAKRDINFVTGNKKNMPVNNLMASTVIKPTKKQSRPELERKLEEKRQARLNRSQELGNLKNNVLERLNENIEATENLTGDIIIYNSSNISVKTQRNVIHVRNILQINSDVISFIYINSENYAEVKSVLDHVKDKLEWSSIIFTNMYKCSKPSDSAYDEFISDNFYKTYTSRHVPPSANRLVKETYLAIRYYPNPKQIVTDKTNLKICTVLKSGGTYTMKHVYAIYNACKKYVKCEFEFYCLTDHTGFFNNIITIPIDNNLNGYWAKLEMFNRSKIPSGNVFYIDLDTLITNDITEIATYDTVFMGLRDFNTLNMLSSGIMKFKAEDNHYIYDGFIKNKNFYTRLRGGDQEAIHKLLKVKAEYIQDIFPRRMAEFKNHCWNESKNSVNIPSNYWIVCFHSKPKMEDLLHDPVIKKYWLT